MSAFKQLVERDIHNVFLNLNEFGEKHVVNGLLLPCVLVRDLNKERSLEASFEGVFESRFSLYVSVHTLAFRPVEGQQIEVDGEYYFVEACAEDMGMWRIELYRNRA